MTLIIALKFSERFLDTKHKKVDKNFGKKIVQYRMAKKWNQKTLGQKINIKEDVIKKYETGTIIPNEHIINKLRRVLGIP